MMRAEIIGAVVIAATIGFTLAISPAAFADAGGVPLPLSNGSGVGQAPPGHQNVLLNQGMRTPSNVTRDPTPGWSQGNKTGWSGQAVQPR